jgi:hypothetical protein
MSFTNITVIDKLTKNVVDFDHTLLEENATIFHLINLIKQSNPTSYSCMIDSLVYSTSPYPLLQDVPLKDNTTYEIEVVKPVAHEYVANEVAEFMSEINEHNLQTSLGAEEILITPDIEIFLQNGSHYIGQVSTINGEVIPHGKGTSVEEDLTYVGMWIYGHKEGRGVATYASSGMVRDGNFVNDEINEGVESHSDGYIYIGSFYDNSRHGKGKDIYPNGSIVEGDYADDEFIRGIVKYTDGTVEEGEFSEDNLVKGIRTRPDGTIDMIG